MNAIIIGPFAPPITGESIANQELFKQLPKRSVNVQKINTSLQEISSEQGSFSIVKVLRSSVKYLQVFKLLTVDIAYLTPGQTFLGVLKYLPFILLAKIFRKKIVLHIHGGGLRYTFQQCSPLKRIIMAAILKRADAGIVLSESLRDNFHEILPAERIFEVRNFAGEDVFEIDFEKKNFQKLKVLYLSNLMIEKGIMDLLEASDALSECNEIEFTIAGNIESSNCQKVSEKLTSSKVNYVGPVSGQEKVALLEQSNILILPTYYKTEGQPISIIEGMSAGDYIITTAHSGIVDIISDKENGSFVEKKSPEDISELLRHLTKNLDSVKKVAKYNYDISRKLYRPERFCEDVIKVFQNVLN